MACPCETRTSTWRSFATISSGLYRFLAIAVLLDVKDIPQVGPLQWGWIRATNAGELTAYRWDDDCRRRKLAIDFSHLVSITYQGRLCMVLCSALNCTKTSTNTAIIIASEVVVVIDFRVRRL